MPACHNHPENAATSTCYQCLKPICDVCTLSGAMQITCVECGRAARRRSIIRKALVGAIIAATGIAFAIATYRAPYKATYEAPPKAPSQVPSKPPPKATYEAPPKAPAQAPSKPPSKATYEAPSKAPSQAPFDYGGRAADVRKYRTTLEKEPCDRIAIVNLGNAMIAAGDNRGALLAAEKFLSTCGEHARLRWITYEAHRRLSEHDAAIAEATKLIELDPYDPDFWWWRGRSYGDKGDWQKAYEDHKRVTTLCPACLGQWELADALEKLGRPCEGIDGLATLLRLRNDIQRDRVEGRVTVLRAKPECKDWRGTGNVKIRFEGGQAFADVKINGISIGRALVDTGASFVVITPELANKAGLRGPFLDVKVRTPDGLQSAKTTVVDLVEAGGLTARHVPIVTYERLATGPLLGMSFLSRFDIVITEGAMELKQR